MMDMRPYASWLIASLLVAGCVSDLNRREATIHYEAALRFDVSSNYERAREQYGKALVAARLAGADQGTLSMLTYNYGRTSGYSCHSEEAEKYLVDALEMEKSVTGPDSGISTKRIFELARFYFDQGDYAKSVTYYSRGLPAVEKLGVAGSDPIALADALDEYSTARTRAGQGPDASAAAQAEELRKANPGKKAVFVPIRYNCSK
jgi:tetratricopeptide (TPR) repeat protein